MNRLIALLVLLAMAGCSSTTPYRDDYARHVNSDNAAPFSTESFRMVLVDPEQVDLRATYENDNTVGDSSVLYQGGSGAAGLLAMVAQIGIHSSLVSSQREEKLAAMQQQANQRILPLLDNAGAMSVTELMPEAQSAWLATDEMPAEALQVKPIFFSAQDLSRLSLKMVIWVTDPKGSKKRPDKYKNLIQVYGKPLNETEKTELRNGNKQLLAQHLSGLLTTALDMAKRAATGYYPTAGGTMKTYKIQKQGKNKVIRASQVDDTCQYTVVRDLRKWLIALPKSPAEGEQNLTVQQPQPGNENSCYTAV
ncbi:hypothetical protein [Alteromonas lipolytica]|uniref:Uncharacterized protein n=1 Tax=Alteromonas lipolytica TaxID=1856405 RepID=A0A1E8FAU3_9ALTE|nr:hypothetical protein [Alteromonas lipolytica]OFI33052.1 hypothetical protein BFC17_01920 [Alteromonas lipolytica]GGF62970.1 hypothetical protein GCM10011338_14230 [Alteromonas lipolytica]